MKALKIFFKVIFLGFAVVFGMRLYKRSQTDQVETPKSTKRNNKAVSKNNVKNESLSGRLEQIMNLIKAESEFEMGELRRMVTNVTERTLRRDLNKLVEMGLIKRSGSTKSTKYKRA